MICDTLYTNVNLATMDPESDAKDAFGTIRDAALALVDGSIAWLGPRKALPATLKARAYQDGDGAWVTPGLIDSHTHLVYAGNRADEFEARLNGLSYEEIARSGGGIASTVAATRRASEEELIRQSGPRLRALLAEGVTTIEVKSGYGQSTTDELKMLKVARRLVEGHSVAISTTLLGAHALPPEYAGRPDDYIALVCEEMIPEGVRSGLIDAVDAFCESIAFTGLQCARVFETAQAAHLPVKLHADQLSDSGGAALAARFRALSADHLEYASEAGLRAMADARTAAVLLPGAFYFLRETTLPPIEAMRRCGLEIAIATDCNPGSSPCTSLLLMLNMACTLFRLTPAEALAGVTRCAASALGLGKKKGRLAIGWDGDLAFWQITHPRDLCYAFGSNPLLFSVFQGVPRTD